jgi:hypothetical protein
MVKFTSVNNYPKDESLIFSCNGTVYTTKVAAKKVVLCQTASDTYVHEVEFRKNLIPKFAPNNIANAKNLYPGTEFDPNTFNSALLYLTKPMRITDLFGGGKVLDVAKYQSLILHYIYSNSYFNLYIYNLEDRTNTLIYEKSISTLPEISQCNFKIGAFANSNKYQDIFISCSVLGTNALIFKISDNEYKIIDTATNTKYNNLNNWCNNQGIIKANDFNGDKLSDLFCVKTKSIMINKNGAESFKEVNLLSSLPGNWDNRFTNQNNIGIGDFDGDGLDEFVSIANNGAAQILFHNTLNAFKSRSDNLDGSFNINHLDRWCGVNTTFAIGSTTLNNALSSLKFVTSDFDNDGSEDVLCINGQSGNGYLMLSKNKPVLPLLKKIEVNVDNFVIGSNLGYVIKEHNTPLFCDAAKIGEYNTKLSCIINSPNKVVDFSKPITPSRSLPELKINANVKGSINLGDSNKYAIVNPNNENILNQRITSSFYHKNNLPRMSFWKLNDASFNNPSREFNTIYSTYHIRQGTANTTKKHLSEYKYGHRTHGGDCNQINFNHITFLNSFTATGRLKAYDGNNTLIKDKALLTQIADLYINSGSDSNGAVLNVGGGAVTFNYKGNIELETLYQKNVTHCSIDNISIDDLRNDIEQPKFVYPTSLCLLQSDSTQGSNANAAIISREDTVQMNGLIYTGSSFYPNSTIANLTSVTKIANQITDVHSRLQYNDNVELNAKVIKFNYEPKNELRITFEKNNKVIYEPAGTNLPYAAFNSIKSVQLAAFNPKNVLIAWSLYLESDKQYYIVVDLADTGGNLLRLSSFNEKFCLAISESKYGNLYFIAYRTTIDKLVITQYVAGTNDPLATIQISIQAQTLIKYELKVEGEILKLIETHNGNKGIIIKKFDSLLNKVEAEANIICTINNPADILATNIDEAYQELNLDFKHNSKIVYHDTQDRQNNLNKKANLQNTLNYINKGLTHLASLNSNPTLEVQVNLQNIINNMFCKETLSYEYLSPAISGWQQLLVSDLTYEIHTATSAKETKCKDSSYYPIYRAEKIVHLCPDYEVITSNINECMRLMDLSSSIKGLITPELPPISSSMVAQYLEYYPANVVDRLTTIMNGAYYPNPVSVCHEGGTYGQASTNVNYIANTLLSGLISLAEPNKKVTATECRTMAANSCTSSTNQKANNLCLTYFIDMASTSYLITQAANSNDNAKLNCQTGCDVGSDALANLATNSGGYLSNSIDLNSFFPVLSKKITDFITAPSGSEGNSSIPTPTNSTEVHSLLKNSNIDRTNYQNVLTASPIYFNNIKASLITFAYLGNDYIDLKAGFYNITNNQLLGAEQNLGRFLNVRFTQTAAFNDSAVLIGYSVKHPDEQNYNILVEYLSPTVNKVVNIFSSYNGIFSIDTVPSLNSAATEFMITYAESNTVLASKRYKVTSNSITEQKKVTESIAAINNDNNWFLSINAFLDNTYNVVWSYLSDLGIYAQRYDLVSGDKIGGTENIVSAPQTVRVGADETGKTIVTWQKDSDINLKVLTQNLATSTSYLHLNFSAANYTLQSARMLDGDGDSDLVALTLKNIENITKTIVANAKSSAFLYKNELTESGGQLFNSSSVEINKDAANININLFEDLLGQISNNIQINNPQCNANNLQNITSQFSNLIKDKSFILNQIQNIFSKSEMSNLLKAGSINKEVIYTLLSQIEISTQQADKVNLASMRENVAPIIDYLKNNAAQLQELMVNAESFNTDINIESIIQQLQEEILPLLEQFQNPEEISEEVFNFLFQKAYEILNLMLSATGLGREFHAQAGGLADGFIAFIAIMVIVSIIVGGIVGGVFGGDEKGKAIAKGAGMGLVIGVALIPILMLIVTGFAVIDSCNSNIKAYDDRVTPGARVIWDGNYDRSAHTLRIPSSTPYNRVTWLTTHNAFTNRWAGYFLAQQELCIKHQLRFGVRGFMLDIGVKDKDKSSTDNLRVCHACSAKFKFHMLTLPLAHSNSPEELGQYVAEFRNFQLEFNEPQSIITILFEIDFNSGDTDGKALFRDKMAENIIKVFKDKGYTESNFLTSSSDQNFRSTLQELWDAGIRIILIIDIEPVIDENTNLFISSKDYVQSSYESKDKGTCVSSGDKVYFSSSKLVVVNSFGESTTVGDYYIYPAQFNDREDLQKLVTNCKTKWQEFCNTYKECLTPCPLFKNVNNLEDSSLVNSTDCRRLISSECYDVMGAPKQNAFKKLKTEIPSVVDSEIIEVAYNDLQICRSSYEADKFRPNFLALDFVNRGQMKYGSEDKDNHVGWCFFGDENKRKNLECEKIVYDYITCNGEIKEVINKEDYNC